MSAIMQASMGFITSNGKLLGTLAKLVEANNEQQSYFYRPNQLGQNENLFQFAQSQEGPSDPPDARQYFNGWDVAQSMFNGALAGGGAGAGLGATVGSILPGAGTFAGGVFGGIFGTVTGSSANGYMEFASQLSDYTEDVENWCDDPINYSHHDYDQICGSGDDSSF